MLRALHITPNNRALIVKDNNGKWTLPVPQIESTSQHKKTDILGATQNKESILRIRVPDETNPTKMEGYSEFLWMPLNEKQHWPVPLHQDLLNAIELHNAPFKREKAELPRIIPNQSDRPDLVEGIIEFNNKKYPFKSSGTKSFKSLPYGDYGPIIEASNQPLRDMGASHFADIVTDPKTGLTYDGMYHLGFGFNSEQGIKLSDLHDGCIAIENDVWKDFSEQILDAIENNEKLYFHYYREKAVIDDISF